MFKDQFGNNITLGDTIVYTGLTVYGEGLKPTLARVVKICAELNCRGEERSYISVEPLVLRNRYTRDGHQNTYQLECQRALKKVSYIIKIDKDLEDLIGTEPVDKPM